MRFLFAFIVSLLPAAAPACDLALMLAVDVSGSVDEREYRIQMDGLAAALRDEVVIDALVSQRAQVSLIQWTGTSRQRQTIDWIALTDRDVVLTLAQRIEDDQRRWRNFSTAIGEAVALSARTFDAVADCKRRVIDVSGDGISNEGEPPQSLRALLTQRGIVVNALAIETDETDLTAYFFENVIHGEGAFVMTADGFEDYPVQIRRKLQRETTKTLSQLR